MNFIAGLKSLILGIVATVSPLILPISSHNQTLPVKPAPTPATVSASVNPTIKSSPLPSNVPSNEEGNYDIKGTYTYLGVSIKYSFRIPKNGGEFSGNIEGACQANVVGNYTKASGEISGTANGNCSIVFVKYKGSINFKGNLYPAEKKLVIQVENAHLQPITLNYN